MSSELNQNTDLNAMEGVVHYELFGLEAPEQVANLPISALAYVGDAVYELLVRQHLLVTRRQSARQLHQQSIQWVKASYQASIGRAIFEELREDERHIFLRGRNHAPGAMPKHANPVDYRYASGLETLVGYLYLSRQSERLHWIFQRVVNPAKEI